MTDENPHFGSSFEDFLIEERIAEEVRAAAIKQALAWQTEQATKQRSGRAQGQAGRRAAKDSQGVGALPSSTLTVLLV